MTTTILDPAREVLFGIPPLMPCECMHDHDGALPLRSDGTRPCPEPARWRVRLQWSCHDSEHPWHDERQVLCTFCLDVWSDYDPREANVVVLSRLRGES